VFVVPKFLDPRKNVHCSSFISKQRKQNKKQGNSILDLLQIENELLLRCRICIILRIAENSVAPGDVNIVLSEWRHNLGLHTSIFGVPGP
jgi:hypothetical protein